MEEGKKIERIVWKKNLSRYKLNEKMELTLLSFVRGDGGHRRGSLRLALCRLEE